MAIALPTAFTAVGILGVSIPLLMVISGLVGVSTTLGRNAFDGLLQHRAPDALLGRAGARYETQFQLAWVFGGVLATPISLPVEVSMVVLTAMYVPALFVVMRGVTEARRFDGSSNDHLGGANVRLAFAHQAQESGAFGVAIIDSCAAADLAQSVNGPPAESSVRRELDDLRRRAVDVDASVTERDATRALQLADRLINVRSQP